jgi:DNA recombination protein RmuC
MGFRTLAIQKKGSEVWKLLAATKVEFENFGGLMAKVEKQVGTVQTTLKLVNSKTRTINRRLRAVEVLDTQAALVTGAEREPSATDAEPATVQADT